MITSASEIREWLDIQAAKFEVRRAAWERQCVSFVAQIVRLMRPPPQPNGYRRARRRYGYRRFPSRRARAA